MSSSAIAERVRSGRRLDRGTMLNSLVIERGTQSGDINSVEAASFEWSGIGDGAKIATDLHRKDLTDQVIGQVEERLDAFLRALSMYVDTGVVKEGSFVLLARGKKIHGVVMSSTMIDNFTVKIGRRLVEFESITPSSACGGLMIDRSVGDIVYYCSVDDEKPESHRIVEIC